MKDYVVAVGLNPAYQKTLFFKELNKGDVNRASRATVIASGKGINFCRASSRWGQQAVLLQFLGGQTGNFIDAALDQEGMSHHTIKVAPTTRTCTTCLCEASGKMTELIEPSGKVTEAELNELLAQLKSEAVQCSGIALCGTVPPGVGTAAYETAANAAREHGIPIMLDAWKDVASTMEIGVDILKINRDELLAMTGRQELKDALKFCRSAWKTKIIAITDGPGRAWLVVGNTLYKLDLPVLDNVINPIGAGDTVSAVMFAEYLKGTEPVEAFATGLAAASASCLSEMAAIYDVATAEKLKSSIEISSENF